MPRPVYQVTARRWAQGWELHIHAAEAGSDLHRIGVTQCVTLDGAEFMARDFVSLLHDVPADSFDLEVRAELGGQQLGESGTRELAEIERGLRGRVARLLDRYRRAR
jgi:hypothetical protein